MTASFFKEQSHDTVFKTFRASSFSVLIELILSVVRVKNYIKLKVFHKMFHVEQFALFSTK